MILNTGQRTDIPAFFSEWFYRRVREGYVLVRNPFRPEQIARFLIDPEVVDLICFCSKNPAPMLPRLGELHAFRQLWHITITPYGEDIEPNVPPWREVAESLRVLSHLYGSGAVFWRYDPIFLTETYSAEFHIRAFEEMCREISGYADHCIFSFLDLYGKTKRNFPDGRRVSGEDQERIAEAFARIADTHGIRLLACCEDPALASYGIEASGCMTREVVERVLGETLDIPASEGKARSGCECLLGHDIGAYNTCAHGCAYCYANYDAEAVRRNLLRHDPASPMLIGHPAPGDVIREAKQMRYAHGQMRFF